MNKFTLRVYPMEHPMPDRRVGNTLGWEIFCCGMMSPLIKDALSFGIEPYAIGTYHLARTASFRGIYVDMLLRGEISDDNRVWLILRAGGDFREGVSPSLGDTRWHKMSLSDWEAAKQCEVTHLPIF